MPREYFPCYHSYLDTIENLDDTERGRLFTALITYSSTGESTELYGNERFVFPGMRSQIDRDNKKYEKKCEKNRQNAALGASERVRSQANGSERQRTVANAPQGKGERKGEGEGEGEREDINSPAEPSGTVREIIEYLNQKAGTRYKASTASTMRHINARLNECFKLDDFIKVIDTKCAEWLPTSGTDKDMTKYLRPETLFGSKFEGYLNQDLSKPSESDEHEDRSSYSWEGDESF